MTDLRAAAPGPAAHFAIPQLRERMRTLFKAAFVIFGNAAALATLSKVPHDMRTGLFRRLVPLEQITRLLITIEAITFLLMTPEGRRLMRDMPRMAIPEPRPAPGNLPDHADAGGEIVGKGARQAGLDRIQTG